ncbi:MAG: baseplate J/gp47 family protein [Lachnospiraceae bacterium]|nr:baseplate J/gp47 family protein [Lachnospiraceae bacterium]
MLEYISSDRKTYDERYEEAISKIPLYTKDWTNFNPSDPGITILEVLTGYETLAQERIDRVPFAVRENLLKMMGFNIRKGRPARLLLSAEGVDSPITIQPNHRFVIGDLIFETNRKIELSGAKMIGIYSKTASGYRSCDGLLDNETRVPDNIFGKHPKEGNALYMVADKLPGPNEELILYVELNISADRNPLTEKMKNPFADVSFEVLTANGFVPCKVRDFTSAFLTGGEIRIRMPEEEAVLSEGYEISEEDNNSVKSDVPPMGGYIIRAILKEANYDVAPRVTAIHPFLFEVWQKFSMSECNTFQRTSDIPVKSSIIGEAYIDIYCKEEKGSTYRKYTYSPDFYEEGRYYTQKMHEDGFYHIDFNKEITGFGPEKLKNCVKIVCYTEEVMRKYAIGKVLGYDNQYIELPFDHLVAEGFSIIARREDDEGGFIYNFVYPEFEGDGALYYHLLEHDGRILIEDAGDFIGAELFLAGVAVTRGKDGNIRAGNELLSTKAFSDTAIRFYNPGPGTGGAERERLEDVRRRFLADMEMPYTAVTEKDFEQLVKKTPGLIINKARAYMDEEKNMVRIAVKPGNDEEYPKLTDYYKKIIMEHLDSRRLLTTRVELTSPVYTRVNVTGTVYVRLNYDDCESQIVRCIKEKIDYINTNKNFGDRLSFDDCFHAIEMLDCVKNVYDLSILPHSLTHAKLVEADIVPEDNCLLYPGDIKIEVVTYDR